jgi:hypothetical protein
MLMMPPKLTSDKNINPPSVMSISVIIKITLVVIYPAVTDKQNIKVKTSITFIISEMSDITGVILFQRVCNRFFIISIVLMISTPDRHRTCTLREEN